MMKLEVRSNEINDYSLRYQEPTPRGKGKEVDINYRRQDLCISI